MKYAATQTADSTKIKKNIYEQRHLFEHTQPTNGVSFYMKFKLSRSLWFKYVSEIISLQDINAENCCHFSMGMQDKLNQQQQQQ